MQDTNYELPPKTVRDDKRISGLPAITRGIYRDLLDLMWLTKVQCSLPLRYDILADRLNTTERQIKKSVKELSVGESPLLNIVKGHQEDYIMSPMLEAQKNGGQAPKVIQFNSKKNAVSKEDELPTMQTFKEESKASLYSNRRYIELDEQVFANTYQNWLPTARYKVNGEAYGITDSIKKTIQANNLNVNIDIILSQVFDWLMKPGNEERRPTFGKMSQLIDRFAKNSEVDIIKKRKSESFVAESLLSDADFEIEMAQLMGNAQAH